MTLHKIWIAIAALAGLPVAGLSILLTFPATLDRSPPGLLLLLPEALVAWSIALFVRLLKGGHNVAPQRSSLLAFYIVAGTVSVWATTWPFSRDGRPGQMFSSAEMACVGIFFIVPVVHLIFASPRTEPGTAPDSGQPRG